MLFLPGFFSQSNEGNWQQICNDILDTAVFLIIKMLTLAYVRTDLKNKQTNKEKNPTKSRTREVLKKTSLSIEWIKISI